MADKQQFNVYLPETSCARSSIGRSTASCRCPIGWNRSCVLSWQASHARRRHRRQRPKAAMGSSSCRSSMSNSLAPPSISLPSSGSRLGLAAATAIGRSCRRAARCAGRAAHPPSERNERVELTFTTNQSLAELQERLAAAGVDILRGAADEGFGYHLILRDPDGYPVKINQLDPDEYG